MDRFDTDSNIKEAIEITKANMSNVNYFIEADDVVAFIKKVYSCLNDITRAMEKEEK